MKDGGLAFPNDSWTTEGMSLRDWFAGQALNMIVGMMDDNTPLHPESIARASYAIADAMLKAREETS